MRTLPTPSLSSTALLLFSLVLLPLAARAADCNGNGIDDADDIAAGTSKDCNRNYVPDECDIAPAAFRLEEPSVFPAGGTLDAVAAGDLDGDLDLDLVAASGAGGAVFGFWNEAGAFSAPRAILAGMTPRAVGLGDLDGDNDLDVAAADRDGNAILVAINEDGGDFSQAAPFPAPHQPRALVLGDLDGDGDLDALAANDEDTGVPCDCELSLFRNDGSGAFGAAETIPVAVRFEVVDLALGDLDGDLDLDLAITDGSFDRPSQVLTLLNDGGGAFAPPSFFPVNTEHIRGVALGDLDGDGDLDVAVSEDDIEDGFSRVFALPNEGGGALGTAVRSFVGAGSRTVALGDLDGDGDLDAATGNRATVSVLFNDDGALASHGADLHAGLQSLVVLGDLDGDGDLDLAAPHSATRDRPTALGVALNTGAGAFAAVTDLLAIDPSRPFEPDHPQDAAAADLDGDGAIDVAVANPSARRIGVFLNRGDGGFSPPAFLDAGARVDEPVAVAAGDLDGDGDLDLVAVSTEPDLALFLNLGGAAFAAPAPIAHPGGAVFAAAADLDGDGDLDLATADRSADAVSVLLNDGTAAFSTATGYAAGDGPSFLAAADLDGDSALDLAVLDVPEVVQSPGVVSVLFNAGGGTFGPPVPVAAGLRPASLAVGDLDGDGDLDLATANEGSSDLSVIVNEGERAFSAPLSLPVAGTPRSVAAADLDGDGALDLAAVKTLPEGPFTALFLVAMLNTNDGSGGFGPEQAVRLLHFGADVSPRLLPADLDGDGDADLLTPREQERAVAVFFNATVPGGGSRDEDGDGIPDECAEGPRRVVLTAERDAFIRSAGGGKNPKSTNEGANPFLVVQRLGITRALVAFDLDGAAAEGLLRATLVVSIASTKHNWGPDGRALVAHRLLADWEEGNGWVFANEDPDRGSGAGVTWHCALDPEIGDHRAECGSRWQGAKRALVPPSAPGAVVVTGAVGDLSWDVTADVLAGAEHGWLIRKERERRWGDVAFLSREGAAAMGVPGLAPRLILEYEP